MMNTATGLEWAHRLGLLTLSLMLLALVLELVRRGYLKERYALLWLFTSAMGLIVGLFPGIIIMLSSVLKLQYLSVLFFVSFLFLMGLVLSFTVVISRLSERNRTLAQEVALLANALRRLEREREQRDRG